MTGAASLNGDIVVTLFGGFAPTLGAQFQIVTAGSITGTPTFDFSAAPLGGGLAWRPIQLSTSLSLEVVPTTTPGDFDFDGRVDGDDLLLWQRAIGKRRALWPTIPPAWRSAPRSSTYGRPTLANRWRRPFLFPNRRRRLCGLPLVQCVELVEGHAAAPDDHKSASQVPQRHRVRGANPRTPFSRDAKSSQRSAKPW